MAVLGKPDEEKQSAENPTPVIRWKLVPGWVEPWRERLAEWMKGHAFLAPAAPAFLAVVGPGVITSNVDNDAGGISVYSQAGAMYGYALLWSLIPMTIALYVTEEMCARMGVVTGKGLSDLIREEFGFRPTFFVILAGLIVDMGNVAAEFAGVAASMQIFGVSKYISVPIAALAVWILVLRGTSRAVEKIFLAACVLYLSYVASALLAKPDWLLAAKETVFPTMQFNGGYLLMLTALIGTTIAPWQFFYLQAGFVEKRVAPPAVPPGARRCDGRQHQLHGDCFLHHRLHGRDACMPQGISTSMMPAKPPNPLCRWRGSGPDCCSHSACSTRRCLPRPSCLCPRRT